MEVIGSSQWRHYCHICMHNVTIAVLCLFLSLCIYFLLVFFSFACFWLPASGEIKMHTRVGDTRGGNWGCHPSIFPEKPGDLFLVITVSASSAVLPLFISSWKTGDLFLLITVTFYWFHSGVTPWKVLPRTFFTCPTSFLYYSLSICPQFFPSGVTPLEGVTRGGPPHPAP